VKSVTVIGAGGFVGSAFVRRLRADPECRLREVTRANYDDEKGRSADVMIDCSGNSRKFLAEELPAQDFDLSVGQRLRTLADFPAAVHVHISSVDVYHELGSPEGTREGVVIDVARVSNYGFHRLLAEELVRHYASGWLIVRLAGMVGPGLKKNPVHDILHGQPLRIHPDSRYQFLNTDDVARLVLELVDANVGKEVFNVCGQGTISPRAIALLAGRALDLSLVDPAVPPRVVDASVEKLRARAAVPSTEATVSEFLRQEAASTPDAGRGGSPSP
jgi:nucleoside-diphosphate-sugar epimerase